MSGGQLLFPMSPAISYYSFRRHSHGIPTLQGAVVAKALLVCSTMVRFTTRLLSEYKGNP